MAVYGSYESLHPGTFLEEQKQKDAERSYAQAIAYVWGRQDGEYEVCKLGDVNPYTSFVSSFDFAEAWKDEANRDDRTDIKTAYELFRKHGAIRCIPPFCRVAHTLDKECTP